MEGALLITNGVEDLSESIVNNNTLISGPSNWVLDWSSVVGLCPLVVIEVGILAILSIQGEIWLCLI